MLSVQWKLARGQKQRSLLRRKVGTRRGEGDQIGPTAVVLAERHRPFLGICIAVSCLQFENRDPRAFLATAPWSYPPQDRRPPPLVGLWKMSLREFCTASAGSYRAGYRVGPDVCSADPQTDLIESRVR